MPWHPYSRIYTSITNMVAAEHEQDIDVGSPLTSTDMSEQFLNQLNSLKTKCNSIRSEICSNFKNTALSDVTSNQIKNCSKLTRSQLFESVSLLTYCTR